ncbi:P-type DNA transfer protein VirB5, partial [Xanthomonas perforans]
MKKYALILAATLALSGTAFAGVPVTVIADVP